MEADGIQVPDQRDPQDGGGSIGQDPLGNGDDDCQGNEEKDKRDADHGVGQQAADTGGGHDLLEHPDNDNGGDEGEKTFNGLPGQRQNIYFAGTDQPGDQSGQGKLQWQPEDRRLEREDAISGYRPEKNQKGKEHPPPAHSGRHFGHLMKRRGQVYRPFLSPAQYKHREDTAYQDGHGKGKLKPDIGDGRPGAENHGPDVDGRSSGAEPGDDEQYARGPFRGDPEEPQGHGHGRADHEKRYAPRSRQRSGNQHDEHQDDQGGQSLVVEGPDGGPDDIVHSTRFIDDGHENRGRGEDKGDIQVGGRTLHQMPDELSGRRRAENDPEKAACQRGQEHADLDGHVSGLGDGIGQDHDSQDGADLRSHGDRLPAILSSPKSDVKKRRKRPIKKEKD